MTPEPESTEAERNALIALKNVRYQCLDNRWGAPALTYALAFTVAVDEQTAKASGRYKEWATATARGRELAAWVIEQDKPTEAV